MDHVGESLLSTLPPRQRLALAYAPRDSRAAMLALLAFDARMADLTRQSREPLLARIRLAWWRERLSSDPGDWPRGEPLLAFLGRWTGGTQALTGLVDGWEGLTGDAPLPVSAFAALARSRADAFAALSVRAVADTARLATNWALADLALHLSDTVERESALDLAHTQDWTPARLDRGLRPLVVLHALASRDLRLGGHPGRITPFGLLTAMRAGWTGI